MLTIQELLIIQNKKQLNNSDIILLENHIFETKKIVEQNEMIDGDIYENISYKLDKVINILEKHLKSKNIFVLKKG